MARYIDHLRAESQALANPKEELLLSLTRLTKGYHPQKRFPRHELHGLYSGPTSVALLFLHLSTLDGENAIVSGRKAPEWCLDYLAHDIDGASSVTVDRCGVANEKLAHLAVSACVHMMLQQPAEAFVSRFLGFVPPLASNDIQNESASSKSPSNEWLYGRAGALYLLRLVLNFYGRYAQTQSDHILASAASTSSKQTMKSTDGICSAMQSLIHIIIASGPNWVWHGKRYLGAVHGDVGILTQLLLSLAQMQADSTTAEQTKICMMWMTNLITSHQLPSGNFPSSIGKERDDLVQFCHGAPGFIISLEALTTAFQRFDDKFNKIEGFQALRDLITTIIEKARECVWERAVLTKEPCLCHGASGNAIALEAEQRMSVMNWTSNSSVGLLLKQGAYVPGDDPWGLFCGEAGRAWAWMVTLGLGTGMIAYSDV